MKFRARIRLYGYNWYYPYPHPGTVGWSTEQDLKPLTILFGCTWEDLSL